MLLVGCVKVTVVLLITHLSALKLQAKLITLAVVLSQTPTRVVREVGEPPIQRSERTLS